MKRVLTLLMALGLVIALTACGSTTTEEVDSSNSTDTTDTTDSSNTTDPVVKEEPIKIGLMITTTGFGDNNFNDMAKVGIEAAAADFGIEWDYVQPGSSSDYVSQLRQFAQTEEYALIIGMGNDMGEAMSEVALEYPDQKFSIVDNQSELDNLNGIYTKMQEQNFLVGVIAGLATKAGVLPNSNAANALGVVYGMEFPNLISAKTGFEAGARFVNPDVVVYTKTADSFGDPALGKSLATDLFQNNDVDVMLHIAGGTGLGVFEAAVDEGFYAIGMGANQNTIQPSVILATGLRAVNGLVYGEVEKIVNGTWEGGTHKLGLADGIVGYTVEGSDVALPQSIIDTVEAVKAMVDSGELTIPDTDELEAWVAANQYTA